MTLTELYEKYLEQHRHPKGSDCLVSTFPPKEDGNRVCVSLRARGFYGVNAAGYAMYYCPVFAYGATLEETLQAIKKKLEKLRTCQYPAQDLDLSSSEHGIESVAEILSRDGECPTHKTPWSKIPGGVSKTTGKSYESFFACLQFNESRPCKQKPKISWIAAKGGAR